MIPLPSIAVWTAAIPEAFKTKSLVPASLKPAYEIAVEKAVLPTLSKSVVAKAVLLAGLEE